MQNWIVRDDDEPFDYECIYSKEHYPQYFSMAVHHDGRISCVDFVSKDEFCIEVIKDIVEELCNKEEGKKVCTYLIPSSTLDSGLKSLVGNEDAFEMLSYANEHPLLCMYIEKVDDENDDEIKDVENEVQEVEVDMKNFKLNLKEDTLAVTIHNELDEDYLSNDSFGTSESEGDQPMDKRRKKALRRTRKQQEGSKDPCTFYVSQVFGNMKLQWRGKAFKDMIWSIASATTIQYFNPKMDDLKSMNETAYNWLKQIPAVHWARSHFTGRAKTDVLLNNLCEVFNSRLVDGRDKPIITALEFVREYLIKRIVNVMKLIEKEHGFLTPTIQTKFEIIKK